MSVIERRAAHESLSDDIEPIGQHRVRISLFGPVEVTTASRRIGAADFPSKKVKQMCQLLAIAGGNWVTKDRLIDALWGDKLPRNPSAAVDHSISLLRSVMVADDGSQPVETERGRYRIDLTVADIDLLHFDELVDWSSTEDRGGGLRDLLEAVDLARGPVLEDEMYASWATGIRDRYSQRVQRVLLDAARSALVHEEALLALALAERAYEESPVVLEEGIALAAAAQVRLGRRHEARLLLKDLELRLADEFGAEISPETNVLQSILDSPETSVMPARPVPVAARLSRPMDALRFVGRETELEAGLELVGRLGDGSSRLVIVEGPPGIGKTAFLREIGSRTEHTVHSFSCLPSDTAYPLYTVHRLIRSLCNAAGLERLPSLGGTVPAMFDQLAEVLDQIGSIVITIDDLHLADDASLAVIAGLAGPHAVRSLTVIAARRVPQPISSDRCELVLARSTVIELGPLQRSVVDSLPVERAWDESGGHPGVLAACVDACRGKRHLSASVVEDLLAWVGPVGSAARTALAVAASFGESFDTYQLAGGLGLCPATTRELVAQFERQHLIREVDPMVGRFEFRAQLMRRLLCESIGTIHRAS